MDLDSGVTKRTILIGMSCAAALPVMPRSALAAGKRPPMVGWHERPYRAVQTNLQLPDAQIDAKIIIDQTRALGANVLIYNVGGIYAFYPTRLEFQAINPFLKGDIVRDVVETAHANGIAVVGRFDFSKSTRHSFEKHPEWFQVGADGMPLITHGTTYQTCVNGGYMQDYAPMILTEALNRYPLDGIFINMLGYYRVDYTPRDHGICVCPNCATRFREMFGKSLPTTRGFGDPAWSDYLRFREQTLKLLTDKLYDTVKRARPETVVVAFRDKRDLTRMETQSSAHSPPPEWPHQAGTQGRWAKAAEPAMNFSSTSTNFIDFPWRRVAVNGYTHLMRMVQGLATGGALDYYLAGTMAQDDTRPFSAITDLYRWYERQGAHYDRLMPASQVAIYSSCDYHLIPSGTPENRNSATASGKQASACLRGVYRALLESRIPFDFVAREALMAKDGKISERFRAIILPNNACLSDHEAALFDAFVARGGLLISTGETGGYDEWGARRPAMALASSPLASFGKPQLDGSGSRFATAGSGLPLNGAKFLPFDGLYFPATVHPDAKAAMMPVAPVPYGPPELSFPGDTPIIGSIVAGPGMFSRSYGRGRHVHLPWLPDWQYDRDSRDDIRAIFSDLIASHIQYPELRLEGAGPVEITLLRQPGTGATLVHLINYSGQRNNRYDAPLPLHGLRLGFRIPPSGSVRLLVSGANPHSEKGDDGYHWITLPPLGLFEAVRIG